MERMNPYEFANLLCIFAQMDGRCADKTIRPRQMSFIEVESASESTKKYEPICIDDIYVEYLYDRMDARQAAEEAINRIINAKEVLQLYAATFPEDEMQIEVSDKQLSVNNGYYYLCKGKCMYSTERLPGAHIQMNITELTNRILQPLNPYMSLMLN